MPCQDLGIKRCVYGIWLPVKLLEDSKTIPRCDLIKEAFFFFIFFILLKFHSAELESKCFIHVSMIHTNFCELLEVHIRSVIL